MVRLVWKAIAKAVTVEPTMATSSRMMLNSPALFIKSSAILCETYISKKSKASASISSTASAGPGPEERKRREFRPDA